MNVNQYWVKWMHQNNHINNDQSRFRKMGMRYNAGVYVPKPSVTTCEIYDGQDLVSTGSAICQPEDQFCKKTGRSISLERALSLGIPREERKAFWDVFLGK